MYYILYFLFRPSHSYHITKNIKSEQEFLIGEEYESEDHDVVAVVLSTTTSCIGKINLEGTIDTQYMTNPTIFWRSKWNMGEILAFLD